jgi:hypothetical protein
VQAGGKATLEKVEHKAQPTVQVMPQATPSKVVRRYKQKTTGYDVYREVCNHYWRDKFKAVALLNKINRGKSFDDCLSQGCVSAHLNRMTKAGITIHVGEKYYLSQDRMHLSRDKFERLMRNNRRYA